MVWEINFRPAKRIVLLAELSLELQNPIWTGSQLCLSPSYLPPVAFNYPSAVLCIADFRWQLHYILARDPETNQFYLWWILSCYRFAVCQWVCCNLIKFTGENTPCKHAINSNNTGIKYPPYVLGLYHIFLALSKSSLKKLFCINSCSFLWSWKWALNFEVIIKVFVFSVTLSFLPHNILYTNTVICITFIGSNNTKWL